MPTAYWCTRWWLLQSESDSAHGAPNPKMFGVSFHAAIQIALSGVRLALPVAAGLVEDAGAQAAVHAGEVATGIQTLDPPVGEALDRRGALTARG